MLPISVWNVIHKNMGEVQHVYCEKHGQQDLKLLCSHLLASSHEPIGFHEYEPENMAWCNECEKALSKTRTDEEQDQWSQDCGYKIVCAVCWGAVKESNQIIKKSMNLAELEQKYNIQYPEIYHQLAENNMLDWGLSGSSWYYDTFPRLKENPPLLLFGFDIEIWNDQELVETSIDEMADDEDYRNIHSDYQFIPFAQNGAGDLYAFQFDLQKDGEVPVTLIPHDDEEAEVLAGNFQDFIFRQLLESVAEIDEGAIFYEEEEEDLKQNLFNQLKTHEPYLTAKQIEILNSIYQRDIFEYTYKIPNGGSFETEGLVTFDEVEEILNKEIASEHLNRNFNYTESPKS